MKQARWGIGGRFDAPPMKGVPPTLTTYRVLATPWFSLNVNVMRRLPDIQMPFHDHGRGFVSLVLKGGYVERRYFDKTAHRRPGRVYKVKRTTWHRIEALPNGQCWTLCLYGRTRAPMGFLVNGEKVLMSDFFKGLGAG